MTLRRATTWLAGLLAICPLLGLAAPHCGAPVEGRDDWPIVAEAERAFDAAAFCRTIAATLAEANLHGIVVDRGGRLQFEAYFDGQDQAGGAWFSRAASFGPEALHDLRSVTKSLTGLLVGVALQRGEIPSLDEPVLRHFPEHADLRTPQRKRITLEHLLTMSAGLAWDESGSYVRLGNSETRMRLSPDPDRYVLERDIVAPPGERFVYSGGATALLGEVLVRRTGQPLDQYAQAHLFGPLGIQHSEWRRDGLGRVTPFGGLRLSPRDLARIGRMLLDGGRWQGRQVVPAAWIEASFQPRLPSGQGGQYGYQWWLGEVKTPQGAHRWIAAQGNGGQRLYLVPTLDLVVVVTAGQYNQPETSWRAPLTVLRRIVLDLARAQPAPDADAAPARR